jgi:predicted ATPase/DNA-binding SARP family transcriptional activator
MLTAGTPHRREKLAGMLWPDSTEDNARDYLRHALWRLRKALEGATSKGKVSAYIVADGLSVSFNADAPFSLDAATIEGIDPQFASTNELMGALSLYEGELLPGFYDDWVVLEREHLQAVYEQKIEHLLEKLQEEARWEENLDWSERWISFGQKPEAAYRFLMTAHAARGDMSKVAATFDRCAKSLDEYGFEPSEQTKVLYEKLKYGKDKFEIKGSVAPTVKPPEPVNLSRTNLPVPFTSFIGRENEIDQILNLLKVNRLLTLTGPGGVGKTRLAIKCANKVLSSFSDGVWWVDLVNLNSPSLVPQAIAKVINLHEVPDQTLNQSLIEHFRSKQALIVLNNCEHLVSACAQLSDQLLSSCADLKILTTSREALNVLGETIWQVPPLTLPDGQTKLDLESLNEFESIRLFEDRSLAVQPAFELNDKNAVVVLKICRRLDGMPLAIELAAARTKIMSTDEIALRLDDCFDLLTAGSRTALPRHQTLRATIDWSYDLLSEPEKTLFRRLSVFIGGFTLEAAEVIAAGEDVSKSQVVDLLGQLINKSLVMVAASVGDLDDETRYGMLETIREYAHEKLEAEGDMQAVQNRHLAYFIDLAEDAESNYFGDKTMYWFRRLTEEIDNIRAAIDWSIESENANEALRLVGALVFFFLFQPDPHRKWLERLNTVLSLQGGQGNTAERAKALYGIGMLYWSDINPADKTAELQEALSIANVLGDKVIIAKALSNLGLFASLRGDLAQARSYLEQSLDIFDELGPSYQQDSYWPQIFLAEVAFNQERTEEARRLYQDSASKLRKIRDKYWLALLVRRLGQIALREGDYEIAFANYTESLKMNVEIDDQRGILACLSAFAGIHLARGNAEFTAHLFGAVQALISETNLRILQIDRFEYERNLAALHDQLDQSVLEKAWAKGEAMTMQQAVEFALKGN